MFARVSWVGVASLACCATGLFFACSDFEEAPNVARWFAALEERPAFQRGIARTVALANRP
jgi:glutathione S-transferase